MQVEADKAFFWSDLHLWHKAAAKARGTDVEEMNRHLLEQALHLRPEDTLFLLGDVSFGKSAETKAWFDRLHCKKVLVMGNHDAGLKKHLESMFDEVHQLLTVKVVEYVGPKGHAQRNVLARIICCHYPILSWKDMHHGSWHLHGHSHGSIQYPGTRMGKVLDVGVDADGFAGPLSFAHIKERMDTRSIVSYDHHKPNMKEGDWTL